RHFHETTSSSHHVFNNMHECIYCHTALFPTETQETCCGLGKIKLTSVAKTTPLIDLFVRHDNIDKDFCKNIRAYNNAFAFTSMGIKLDKHLANASQVAAIWIEGNDPTNYTKRDVVIHSRSQGLQRVSKLSGSYNPMQYLLLFSRGDHGQHPEILQNGSLKKITAKQYYSYKLHFRKPLALLFYAKTTPLIDLFVRHDNIDKDFCKNIRAYNNAFAFTSMGIKLDKHLANASQVAAIWIEGNDPTNYTKRDVVIHSRSQGLQRVSKLSGSYNPMQYLLLFSRGDHGQHPEILQNGSLKKITAKQYYSYKLHFRKPLALLFYDDNLNELPKLLLSELNIPVINEDLAKIEILNENQNHHTQIVKTTLKSSTLWSNMEIFKLHQNMRVENNLESNDFKNFLIRIGNRTEKTIGDDMICILDNMVIKWHDEESLQTLIKSTYPSLYTQFLDTSYFTNKIILTTKNEHVDYINNIILDKLLGNCTTYRSFNFVPDDTNNLY
ncbi:34002_t:CDS:2, partial [Racocetra persica]